MSECGEDEIEYHEKVAGELAKLIDLDQDTEVNLWFEYELFCSVNMWFCLWLLSETGATVYRVEPVILDYENRWLGFGKLEAADLQKCFDRRTAFSAEDIKLGVDLWNAYRKDDKNRLAELGGNPHGSKGVSCFPYLAEVVAAAIEKDTRPAEIVAEIQFEGKTEFEDIFPEFTRRAGVYGFGDLQVKRIMESTNI